jgi:ABC-type transport system involved in multi-copper enzyme maturation permease subunit
MQHSNSRVFAMVGVVIAAIAAACLVWPAARQLGPATGLLAAAAIIGIPVLLALAVSGTAHYGALASSVVALVIAVITCVVSWVVAAFAFATALSGSVTGLVLALVLFGGPALCVLILGLLALRVVPARSDNVAVEREPQHH